jgi:RNA polymerase sigma-70 factor (ECF subfamily)
MAMTRPARPSRIRGATGGRGKKHAPARDAPADAAALNLTTIYREHGQFIWLSLQRFGVRVADLDDLAQDVFMVVHRKLSHLDPRGPITPWLFGICMRIAANYRRRRRWKVEVSSSGRDHNRAAELPLADDLIIKAEDRELAERALATLDVGKRAIFVMFEIEELPCAEIAWLMNVPVGTVYSRLHAARRQLNKALARSSRSKRSSIEK